MSLYNFIKSSLGLVIFLFLTSATYAQEPINNPEYIQSFDTQITINQDTSLSITEQIDYVTSLTKHGIYRYVPYRYTFENSTYTMPISNFRVTDENGQRIPFTKSKDREFITLKIGDPDKTFTGEQTYVISYRVERAIDSYDTHDELYWDITGEGWSFPILSSSAVVNSPHAQITDAICYTGKFGSDNQNCNIELGERNTSFFNDSAVTYGDNFTIALKLNSNNQLVFPSQLDLLLIWIKDNWILLLIPLPAIVLFFAWIFKGRDFEFISQNVYDLDPNKPQRLQPMFSLFSREPLVYEPLEHLSPGEAGALLDEKVDTQDIVAEILELARKKHLQITAEEKKGFLSSSTDYIFTKLKDEPTGKSDLTEVQSYLFGNLFQTKDEVKVSDLKGTFHTTISHAKQKMETALVGRDIYVSKPTVAKGMGITGVIVFYCVLFFIFGFGPILSVSFSLAAIILLIVSILLSFLFAAQLGQKTAVGTNLFLQSKGLRAAIKRGAWREKINEKHLFIQEILPYAVSLGVVKQLANDMEDLDLQPPDYIKTNSLNNFSTAAFVSSFSNEVGSSLSYNPSSSSSGGSGFSGGGFSGGGGGGGGGGSW